VNFNLALAILFFKKLIIVNKIQQVAEVQKYTHNSKYPNYFAVFFFAAFRTTPFSISFGLSTTVLFFHSLFR